MRRFSQRNSLVTLSDINITPLLDLAFVLLIIFIITTPLLEQSIKMTLPSGGAPDRRKLDKNDIRTIEISPPGGKSEYKMNRQEMTLQEIERELIKSHASNPNLAVDLRADKRVAWEKVATIFDICIRNGIFQVSPRTVSPSKR